MKYASFYILRIESHELATYKCAHRHANIFANKQIHIGIGMRTDTRTRITHIHARIDAHRTPREWTQKRSKTQAMSKSA